MLNAALWVLNRTGPLTTFILRLIWRVSMPRASIIQATETHKLTTLPAVGDEEQGFVELRRLTFGEKLSKDAEAMKMRFGMNKASQGDIDAEVSLISEFVTYLEFAKCIISHNLTTPVNPKEPKGEQRPLNFKNQADVQCLDPRVGDEISKLIGEMNDFEAAAKKSEMDSTGK